jgi:drug/metabolite transporter (DMT)-like permease
MWFLKPLIFNNYLMSGFGYGADFVQIKTIGVLAILGASIMWAIEPIIAKLSFQSADFIQTSGIRAIFAAITALLYVILSKNFSLSLTRKQVPSMVYIAVVGTLVADLLYFFALTMIPVINAVLIGHMQPIFIVVMGWVVLRQDKLNKFDYMGILVMILSAIFVTSGSLERLVSLQLGSYGDLIVLCATITWATAAIVMRRFLRDVHAGVLTFYRFFIASLVFTGFLVINNSFFIQNYYQIFLGVLIGVGTVLYYEGLKRIKAAQVGALELSTPLFAAVLGFFVLNESIAGLQVIGILLLVVGIYFLSKKEV